VGESSSESCAVCRTDPGGVSVAKKCETPASIDDDAGIGPVAGADDVEAALLGVPGVVYEEVASAWEICVNDLDESLRNS
jgi:hypothetical protein